MLYQGPPDPCYSDYETRILGLKSYEITDHLGNPRVIFNDKRLEDYELSYLGGTSYVVSYIGSRPEIDPLEMNNYYPFGMLKEGMFAKTGEGYRYGFNGMERDNETKGFGNDLSTFFRGYDPRLARWKSVDPVVHHWESPFVGFANNPVLLIDPRGDDTSSVFIGQNDNSQKVFDDATPTAKQGDMISVFRRSENGWGAFHVDTKIWHAGNDFHEEGWLSEGEYEYFNRDWHNGQVYNKLSWVDKYIWGEDNPRNWYGWEVNTDGYLTGQRYMDIKECGKNPMRTIRILIPFTRQTRQLYEYGKWTIYYYIKQGQFYFGKAKNGINRRYAQKFINKNNVQPLEGLNLTIKNWTAPSIWDTKLRQILQFKLVWRHISDRRMETP